MITKAIDIIGGLGDTLDQEKGGKLAADLYKLYDYMQRRLVQANIHSDLGIIDEVIDLLRDIKEGWDAIG